MFSGFCKWKTELRGNGLRLLAANGKWKWQTSVCLMPIETENGSLFFLVVKRQRVIDDCCFSQSMNKVYGIKVLFT
jgi:hypothetical protein